MAAVADAGEGARSRLRRLVGLEHVSASRDAVEHEVGRRRGRGRRAGIRRSPTREAGRAALDERKPPVAALGGGRDQEDAARAARRRTSGRRAASASSLGAYARARDVAAEHRARPSTLAAGQRGQPRAGARHPARRAATRPRAMAGDRRTSARHRDPAARQLLERSWPAAASVEAETAEVRGRPAAPSRPSSPSSRDDRRRIAAGRLVLGDHRHHVLVDELADGQDHLAALLGLALARGEGAEALAVALEQLAGDDECAGSRWCPRR